MTRRYDSPVREEKAARTRASLLEACEALLLEGPVEAVTLPAVARRAGVTKPTAYSHFPDNDALMAGFLEHTRARIGMLHDVLTRVEPKQLPATVRENYARFDENAELLQRMMTSPSYERVRLARKVDRAKAALPVWEGVAPERELRERLGAIYLLVSPASWLWLRKTWGLDGPAAANAAAWAMDALVAGLLHPTRTAKKKKGKGT